MRNGNYRIKPTLSPGRRAWLERLVVSPAKRGRGRVGYDCMQLGWAEWDYRRADTGMPISQEMARLEFGDQWFHCVRNPDDLERITAAGRAALRESMK